MFPHSFRIVPVFFLVVIAAGRAARSQEPEKTEVRVIEMKHLTSAFGGGEVRMVLTADDYVERLTIEYSTNLVDWTSGGIYDLLEGDRATFQKSHAGTMFFRGAFSRPTISVEVDEVTLVTGVSSSLIAITRDDYPYLVHELPVTAESSNPQLIPGSNIEFSGVVQGQYVRITPAFGGEGPVTITLTATAPDGVTAQTSFIVNVVDEGGIAPGISDFYDKVLHHKYPGLNYIFSATSPSQRFIRNGEPGNWFYVLNPQEGADKAILGFSYDENDNEFTEYAEVINLTFTTNHSGTYQYAEVVNDVPQNETPGTFDLDAFPFFGAGAAPAEAAFARMAVGKHIVNSAWTFDSETRFNYTEPKGGTPERGNWKYIMTGETTGRVTLTYDEDNNNATVYREEVDLTFETLETGSFIYREYFGAGLNNTFPGVFDFSQ